jgi:hypothetical protein
VDILFGLDCVCMMGVMGCFDTLSTTSSLMK